jgi:hypothetical protein
MKKTTKAAITAAILALTAPQIAFADMVNVYTPITAGKSVMFEAGETEGGYDGEQTAEGTGDEKDSLAAKNSLITDKAAGIRNGIVENPAYAGDRHVFADDTKIVTSETLTITESVLRPYIIELLGYDTVQGMIPATLVPKYEKVPPVTTEYTEIEITEGKMKEVKPIEGLQSDALSYIADKYDTAGTGRSGSGGSGGGGTGGGDGGNEGTDGGNESADGGNESADGDGTIPFDDLREAGVLPEFDEDEFTETVRELVLEFDDVITAEWSLELREIFKMPKYGLAGGAAEEAGDSRILTLIGEDTIPGGIADTGYLEPRFALIELYLNSLGLNERIKTNMITEYRLTEEVQGKVTERVPTDNYIWGITNTDTGADVLGDIRTTGRYLRFVFNTPGNYRIRADQETCVTRADTVSYDINRYWVLNNGDAFDGLVIWRDHKKNAEYRTNFTSEFERVPVSAIDRIVTPEMTGVAYIAGPGGGLVGIKNEFDTQRYK